MNNVYIAETTDRTEAGDFTKLIAIFETEEKAEQWIADIYTVCMQNDVKALVPLNQNDSLKIKYADGTSVLHTIRPFAVTL